MALRRKRACSVEKRVTINNGFSRYSLPDGSKDWDTSIKLAKAAVKDGVTHAICTPHTLNGRYTNHKDDIIWLTDLYQKKLDEAKIPLIVFPGQEVRLSGDLIDALDNDDILFCDEDGTYMLLEFPSEDVPTYAQDTIFKIMQRGVTPIIVHPERNSRILKEPEILQGMLEQGCLVQITASSYTGIFGKKIEEMLYLCQRRTRFAKTAVSIE